MSVPGLFSGSVEFLVLSGLGGLVLGLDRRFRSTLRDQLVVFWGAFAVRFAIALLVFPGALFDVLEIDDSPHWLKGVELHRGWVAEGYGLRQVPGVVLTMYEDHHQGYYYLLGALFYVTGPARFPVAVFNGFLGSLTIVLMYRLTATFFSRRAARFVGFWLSLLPSMVIWCSQPIKEPVVWLLEVFAIYGFMMNQRAGRPRRAILVGLLCVVLLVPFRIYAAIAVLMTVVAAAIFPLFQRSRSAQDPARRASLEVAWIAIAGVIWIVALNSRYIQFMNLDFLRWLRSYNARGASSIPSAHNLRTLGGFTCNFLEGGVYLLLAPFPWHLAQGSPRMQLAAPEMIVWWWLFFRWVLPGLWSVLRTRAADFLPVLLWLSIYAALQAMVFGNLGHAIRQRTHLLIWLLMFAGSQWEQRTPFYAGYFDRLRSRFSIAARSDPATD